VASNFEKLQKLLEELFQLDQADLDFGIYRIMNQKRDEVVRFLEKDLLPQVKDAFGQYRSADKVALQKQLDAAIEQAKGLGVDPETTTKVQELRQQLADSAVDVNALENEVFSHLYNFFRRYYHEGDFISLRRYKEGVYAIPYEGEEVKLHWANHDQYYIKSSEYFRDYVFTMPSGKRVRVHLVAASSEQDNKKEAPGKERRFILCDDAPLSEENGELFIRFEYRPDDGKQKQDVLNQKAIETILGADGFDKWIQELSKPAPTKANPERTVLEKHLHQYTAKNTFDYFIHKDLGGFLRRELDFYIKNEIMHLDDIEHDTAPRVEQFLSKIKVIRKIAHKIIQFLEQLENFQKKLWLKKKFVVETHYCITLDIVPEELFPEIAANNAQREEWIRLFAVHEIEKDLNNPGYSTPLTVDFLKANTSLSINTRLFPKKFTAQLLSRLDDVRKVSSNVLVNSDNSQALRLMKERYRKRVRAVYIDPPYNTPHSEILYKNNYLHSTWLTLIANTASLVPTFWAEDFSFGVAIDDFEFVNLASFLRTTFPELEHSIVVVNHHPQGAGGRLSRTHEYLVLLSRESSPAFRGRPREDATEDRNFMRSGTAENNFRQGRWKSFYALLIDPKSGEIVGTEPPVPLDEEYPTEPTPEGYRRVYPINSRTEERVWRSSYETGKGRAERGELAVNNAATVYQRIDHEGKRETLFSNWTDSEFNAGVHGTSVLSSMGFGGQFDYPKSINAVEVALWAQTYGDCDATILDYFAGSGTTAHAVMAMNRLDGGNRNYLLVEQGEYFQSVLVSRVRKAAYSTVWKDGKPQLRDGISHSFKYMDLESFDDSLNNIEPRRTGDQASLLEQDGDLREQYILSYILEVDARGSQSLLNVDAFRNPYEYKLRVERNGEMQLVNVDLIETFNWLLGLTVKHIDMVRGVWVVEGTNPDGKLVLVLWRNLDETDNDKLDDWFKKQKYNTLDQEYDVVYVNGDNNLENFRTGDQTWKVRLIEEEFGRLMFDVQDA